MKKIINKISPISLIIAFVSMLIIGCAKENKGNNEELQEILSFKSVDEYEKTKQKVLKMSVIERSDWERKSGFVSFATLADKIYEEANPENFSTQEELLTFIESNKTYLQLIKKNNDLTVETVLYSNSDRFLMNKDRMVRIENTIYKFFEKNIAQGTLEQYEMLQNLKDEEVKNGIQNTSPLKTEAHGLSDYYEDDKTDGRDRIHLRVSINHNAFNRIYTVGYMVRPYMRTLGVYYHCNRTISHCVKMLVGYEDGSGRYNEYSRGDLRVITYPSPVSHFSQNQYIDGYIYSRVGFVAINAWARSPSVGMPAVIKIGNFHKIKNELLGDMISEQL